MSLAMSALVIVCPVLIAWTQLPKDAGSTGTFVIAAAKVGASVGKTARSMRVWASSQIVTPEADPGAIASTRLHRAASVDSMFMGRSFRATGEHDRDAGPGRQAL